MHSLRTGNSNCCLSCDHDMVMHCERAAWSHDGLVREVPLCLTVCGCEHVSTGYGLIMAS